MLLKAKCTKSEGRRKPALVFTRRWSQGLRLPRASKRTGDCLLEARQRVIDHPRALDRRGFGQRPLAAPSAAEMTPVEKSIMSAMGMLSQLRPGSGGYPAGRCPPLGPAGGTRINGNHYHYRAGFACSTIGFGAFSPVPGRRRAGWRSPTRPEAEPASHRVNGRDCHEDGATLFHQ